MEAAAPPTQFHQWKSAEPGERVARKQLSNFILPGFFMSPLQILCTLFLPPIPLSPGWSLSFPPFTPCSPLLFFSLPIKSVGPWTSRNGSQPTVLPCSRDETRRYIGRARPARAACPRGAPQGSACLAPSSLSIFFLLPSSVLRTQMSAESHFFF